MANNKTDWDRRGIYVEYATFRVLENPWIGTLWPAKSFAVPAEQLEQAINRMAGFNAPPRATILSRSASRPAQASRRRPAPPQLLCRFQVDAAVGLVVLRVSTDLLWQYLRSEAGTKAWPNILPSPRRLSQMLLSKGDGGSRCPLGCLLPAMHTHYQWADIPRALVKQWTAQRPRRSRTIRELDATRPAEPAV